MTNHNNDGQLNVSHRLSRRLNNATGQCPVVCSSHVDNDGTEARGISTSRCPVRLPVNSSHGHLVTRSCRHTVNSSPIKSSHARIIIQSTRHKQAHNKTTSTSRNYVHAVRIHPETVLNTDDVITAICVTLMYTARRQITLLRKARSTRHNAVKQWSTRHIILRCDELTV